MKTDEHENLTSRHLVHMWLPSTKAQRGMAIFPLHLVTNIVGIHLDHQTVGDTCYDMTLSMLWHLLWYSTRHGTALGMVWHSSWYNTCYGKALNMAWHLAWYGTQLGMAYIPIHIYCIQLVGCAVQYWARGLGEARTA